MKHQPPPPTRRWGVVAAVVALVLLACLQIQYQHLKVALPPPSPPVLSIFSSLLPPSLPYCRSVDAALNPDTHAALSYYLQVDLGKAGFASATQENNAIPSRNRIRWGTARIRKAANGADSLPRGIVQRHSDMSLRPLWEDDAASTHKVLLQSFAFRF